jgi:hypothetical protein
MNQAGFAPMIDAPRRWDFLAGMMNTLGFKTFVEVGCKEGRTTGHILKNVEGSKVLAIDPWIVQETNGDPTRETYKDWDFEKIQKEFCENCGVATPFERNERLFFWQGTSEAVASGALDSSATFMPAFNTSLESVAEGSLLFDLVFIDALHDQPSVEQDIALWWPTVRPGGVLAGHDFNHKWPGVQRAVAKAFDLMDIGVGPDSVWFMVKNDNALAAS